MQLIVANTEPKGHDFHISETGTPFALPKTQRLSGVMRFLRRPAGRPPSIGV
jgi:hypothetical protein